MSCRNHSSHNYGYSHNESNGNGHISNGKIMEAESGEKNGFYNSSSNSSHGHPVCLTSYQTNNDSSMPPPSCPALPPPGGPVSNEKKAASSMVTAHLRSALVILALSIHSLFEGMAVGLEESDSGVWKLFLAIAIHGSAIAFCIGTEMVTTASSVLLECSLGSWSP